MDKRKLLRARLEEDDVEIPGVGTVRVRALSRADVLDGMREVDRSVPGAIEARMVALSLVDPELTDEEVLEWRKRSRPTEIGAVVDKINDLSGLADEAAKDAYKEFEENPDESFRVLPGAGAEDDGGAAEG